MPILQVITATHLKQWEGVPDLIYKNDTNWIPHIKQDVARIFDPAANKLFNDGNAARWIVANNDGIAIGRIAAFHSKKYSDAQSQKTGGIGFFECIDDANIASQLLDTAVNWLKTEGMQAVDGPINFGEKEAYWGLLVMNFTDMSSFRMNYNPPYYKKFFEDFGFKTYYEQLCYKRDLHVPAQEVFVRKTDELMKDPGYRIANARGRSIEEIAFDFVTIYNASWAGLAGFKEMHPAQALQAIRTMQRVMDPDIMVFVYHNEKPIAFYINLPEVNEFMQHVNGNLNWLGIIKFLYHKQFGKRHTMVGIVFGVSREYHGKGVEGAMIKWSEENIVTLNRYNETIMTWIGDFNPKMMHVAENLGASLYRKLITYRMLFDKSQVFKRLEKA